MTSFKLKKGHYPTHRDQYMQQLTSAGGNSSKFREANIVANPKTDPGKVSIKIVNLVATS